MLWLLLGLYLQSAPVNGLDRLQIDSLKNVPTSSPGFASAQERLALLYLAQNTVTSRRLAESAARKAIAHEPENFQHQVTLCRILYERGFYIALEETCDRIIRNAPQSNTVYASAMAEACYYKGLVYERSGLKYKDMISPVTDDYSISLSNFGVDDIKTAARWYESAITHDARHRDALFHLGLLYYEIRGFATMVRLYEKVVHDYPDDTDAYMFAALGSYQMGEFEKCQRYYREAMDRMTPEEFSEFTNIGYIVSRKQKDEYLHGAGNPTQAARFERQFWKQKDPLYLTSFNERQLEHYNRMAYVNLRFGVPRMKLPGWKTERGQIYIRFGKPERQIRIQPDERHLGGQEIWLYSDQTLRFYDDFASGKYIMDNASLMIAETAPADQYSLPPERLFDLQARVYQFRNPDGSTRVRSYFRASADRVDPDFNGFGIDVEADAGFFLINKDYDVASELRRPLHLGNEQVFGSDFRDMLEIAQAKAGSASGYAVEIVTRGDRRIGTVRDTLSIRNFNSNQLLISDIIVGEASAAHSIQPYFENAVPRGNTLAVYFEVYNLFLDESENGRFHVELGVTPVPSVFVGMIETLLGKKGTEVRSAFDSEARSRDEQGLYEVDLSELPAGQYTITVTVSDKATGTAVTGQVPLTITDGGKK